jgi:hypothetical protein
MKIEVKKKIDVIFDCRGRWLMQREAQRFTARADLQKSN